MSLYWCCWIRVVSQAAAGATMDRTVAEGLSVPVPQGVPVTPLVIIYFLLLAPSVIFIIYFVFINLD